MRTSRGAEMCEFPCKAYSPLKGVGKFKDDGREEAIKNEAFTGLSLKGLGIQSAGDLPLPCSMPLCHTKTGLDRRPSLHRGRDFRHTP